ncbi:hypothetical protein JHD48_00835 [Sulfurimonas sp. SAG-AH-194-I05]|nr:hypothetical protein [Sulfurimonas sp. SAG-AH-194-I05]MDF1874273.1 hypothetical protein [Sulfurimonas sp. SAG-AH-194-I05]
MIIKLLLVVLILLSPLLAKEDKDLFSKEKMDKMSAYIVKKFYDTSRARRNTSYMSQDEYSSIEKKAKFLKEYKKEKKTKAFYKATLEAYQVFIKSHRTYITKWNAKSRSKTSNFYKQNIKSNTEFLNKVAKHLKYLSKKNPQVKSSLTNKYTQWTKSKASLNVSTVNKNKSIVNKGKVSIEASHLRTTVKASTITLAPKAKASIGSVSIGKE